MLPVGLGGKHTPVSLLTLCWTCHVGIHSQPHPAVAAWRARMRDRCSIGFTT